MQISFNSKIYKDKLFVLPLAEFSWQKVNKIFTLKLAFWKWALNISFNF